MRTVPADFPLGRSVRLLPHRIAMHDFTKHEKEYLEALLDHLEPGMVVIDVGAEEGEFTALVAKEVGGQNVHIIEPSGHYWPNIRAVWEANVDVAPGGCWAGFASSLESRCDMSHHFKKRLKVWPDYTSGPIRKVGGFSFIDERPDIPCLSLDYYCSTVGIEPDVIMMDIEGAEGLALLGSDFILRKSEPTLFVSVHSDDQLERYSFTRERLFELMTDRYGYSARLLGEDHEEHWVFSP